MWGRIFFHSITHLNFKCRQFSGKQILGTTLGYETHCRQSPSSKDLKELCSLLIKETASSLDAGLESSHP